MARPIAMDLPSVRSAAVVASRQVCIDDAVPCRRAVTHSHAALAFHTGGRSRVQLRGDWMLGEGDVLLVPAGEPHRRLESSNTEFWGLSLQVPSLTVNGAASLFDSFERVRDGASAVVHIPVGRHEYLASLFRELEELGGEQRGASETLDAVQASLLTLILAEVKTAASRDGVAPSIKAGVVVEALRFIERNCLRPLTLNEVAAAVGRSPAHVTTALARATGRSAGQWILSGRMAEARRLLLHSDERVEAVAGRVGYADSTHFIRMFRREHGSTPAAWRRDAQSLRCTSTIY